MRTWGSTWGSAIIRYFAPKYPFFMPLGAFRLKRVALVAVVLVLASMSFLSCGYSCSSYYKPPSGLTTRVLSSQSVSRPTALPGLLIVNGANDTVGGGGMSAGTSPGLMAGSPDSKTFRSFDSGSQGAEGVTAR